MQKSNLRFRAIGTEWQIETPQPLSQFLRAKITARIEAFDKTYSRFRSDSLVAKVAKQKGDFTFPDDVLPMIEFYRQLYSLTGGKMTPLVGSLLEQAGYDAEYSFREKAPMKPPSWEETMAWRQNQLTTTRPITLDFGAAGKGYLVDIVSALLEEEQIDEYVVDASGDLRHHGTIENRVGLESPFDTSRIIGVMDVRNKSLCASATNRRTWGNGLHHIFDPDTQKPVSSIVATWVVADTTMIADGLATALFFVPPEALQAQYDFQYVLMRQNKIVDYSQNFEGELFQ